MADKMKHVTPILEALNKMTNNPVQSNGSVEKNGEGRKTNIDSSDKELDKQKITPGQIVKKSGGETEIRHVTGEQLHVTGEQLENTSERHEQDSHDEGDIEPSSDDKLDKIN